MTFTETLYTCVVCRQQYQDGLAALGCHRRGWIRKPVPLTVYDLGHDTLLVLATAISSGLHKN